MSSFARPQQGTKKTTRDRENKIETKDILEFDPTRRREVGNHGDCCKDGEVQRRVCYVCVECFETSQPRILCTFCRALSCLRERNSGSSFQATVCGRQREKNDFKLAVSYGGSDPSKPPNYGAPTAMWHSIRHLVPSVDCWSLFCRRNIRCRCCKLSC